MRRGGGGGGGINKRPVDGIDKTDKTRRDEEIDEWTLTRLGENFFF